jgi:hypothetical protein
MTGVTNSSSAYFLAVHSGTPTFPGVLIFILITMGYAVYVTLWALFQMQFAGMMHLVPHRTSAVCLSFNARMCARLAAPMAFFYLGESLAGSLLREFSCKVSSILNYTNKSAFLLFVKFRLIYFLPARCVPCSALPLLFDFVLPSLSMQSLSLSSSLTVLFLFPFLFYGHQVGLQRVVLRVETGCIDQSHQQRAFTSSPLLSTTRQLLH